MGDFDGKVALITGASSGVGKAAAFEFARRGANVVLAARRTKEGGAVAQTIREDGGKALFVQTDVSDMRDVERMVEAAVKSFGRLDFAFNNAGIEGNIAITADSTEENWDNVIGINLTGAWLCMKYEIPEMLKTGGGAIVNMASDIALVGARGLPAYVASRFAVVGLTKSAALEYADKNIRINVVCPGIIETPMWDRITEGDEAVQRAFRDSYPAGRTATSEEIAAAAAWVCSDAASYMSGHALSLDGGHTAGVTAPFKHVDN
ncbi:MAG: glucose 1-dehydrogenase [Chloroflexi bacterium]|nr:glucose 1-dehydrogenase [Chloroflexota bacterium]